MKQRKRKLILISKCLICNGITYKLEDKQIKVRYAVCQDCGFIHKDKEYHVGREEELNQYSLHNNSFESEGYVNIFVKLINEYITPLNIMGNVLEYGSGPGPVLKELLIRDGYNVYDYDPFFNNNKEYLNYKYELITSTEVVEHFFNPLVEFARLSSLLKHAGYLVITTKLRTMEIDSFLDWWYRRDTTHVSFYTMKSLSIIAKLYNLKIVKTNDIDTIVFQKI
ncbi:MAG: class I SAM-dependent methyltransferase [Candidatus Izimaplasma sp.]|nr:class I SAM-dependent methyltransferase [Candidatus Izimaplasma bacterium]